MVNIIQVALIVVSVVILFDSINLLTNTSKILVKSSMKLRTICNSRIRGAIAKNHDKTAKNTGNTRYNMWNAVSNNFN